MIEHTSLVGDIVIEHTILVAKTIVVHLYYSPVTFDDITHAALIVSPHSLHSVKDMKNSYTTEQHCATNKK